MQFPEFFLLMTVNLVAKRNTTRPDWRWLLSWVIVRRNVKKLKAPDCRDQSGFVLLFRGINHRIQHLHQATESNPNGHHFPSLRKPWVLDNAMASLFTLRLPSWGILSPPGWFISWALFQAKLIFLYLPANFWVLIALLTLYLGPSEHSSLIFQEIIFFFWVKVN